MERAIDKQTMLDLIIEAKRTDPETGSFAEWLAEYLVEHLPTLTPPNEPLTWNELGNMVGKPVYIVELEDGESCWVLVHTVDDIKALFVSAFDQYDYGNRELYGQTWLVYRRPPEGEADD